MGAKRVSDLKPEAAKLITQICVRAALRAHQSPSVAKNKAPSNRDDTKS